MNSIRWLYACFVCTALTSLAHARPGGDGGSGTTSSTFHPSSGGSHVDAGTVIAAILGLGIFVVVVALLVSRSQASREVRYAQVEPPRLNLAPVRTLHTDFSRVAFEERAADLARAELAKRSGRDVLIGDVRIREVAATGTRITCVIEANAGGTYGVGTWTFLRGAGDSTWTIDRYEEVASGRGPQLVSMGPEIGNDLPTLTDEQAIVRFTQLRDEDKTTSWEGFVARVKDTYARVNEAWNTHDLSVVQGFVAPRIVEYLTFWSGEYERQQLVNRHDDAQVRHVGLAHVSRDPTLDAVTVRVYASGLDYTTRTGTSEVVGGSKTDRREYTEYWTFVRPKGTTDWLLTKIEQDELYDG
ncbi:MAG TPA: TIM44-like domain-containing protein [Kofleriaceae bacterium]|nr:TIM44-like domain-containing protein [Kofleriaceae bacterium]